jgi:hypothetical protein
MFKENHRLSCSIGTDKTMYRCLHPSFCLIFQECETVDPLDRLSTTQVIKVLLDTYQTSPYAMQAAAKVREITQIVSKRELDM